jgi:hypothetical protein
MSSFISRLKSDFSRVRSGEGATVFNEQHVLTKFAVYLALIVGGWNLLELSLGHELYLVDPTRLPTITDAALVQAAWFQAIGSVVAIIAAIWIANRQAEHSRDLIEDDRRRRALVEGGVLVSLFQGVSLEARAKGQWMLALARGPRPEKLSEVLKSDSERLRFASIDLLQQHYSSEIKGSGSFS